MLAVHAPTTTAAPEANPQVTPLIADGGDPATAFQVGVVEIWNDGSDLSVTYQITLSGWCLVETHLHIAEDVDDIPQTESGNPIPGQFDHQRVYDCVDVDTYTIPLDWDVYSDILIAAHAAVELRTQTSLEVVSNPGDSIYGPIYTDPFANSDPFDDWGTSFPSVEAKNWLGISPNPIDEACGGSWLFSFNWGNGQKWNVPGAQWISTTENTSMWWQDSWRRVQETFTVPGIPLSGSLTVNADNEYWAYVDGVQVGHDDQVFGPIVPHSFTPAGAHTLDIVFKNFAAGTPEDQLSQCGNPNGLTYSAVVDYLDIQEASAWGDGVLFPGSNWATYIEYRVTCNSGSVAFLCNDEIDWRRPWGRIIPV